MCLAIDYDFDYFSRHWVNDRKFNDDLYAYFERQVDVYDYLWRHYQVITENRLGFGEKAFRYFWLLILSQLKDGARFLEIGVYKGSILALSQAIAQALGIRLVSVGLTPLDPTGDKYSAYPAGDYLSDIKHTFGLLGLSPDLINIIRGRSTDPAAALQMGLQGPWDVIYIDGGHDYSTVMNDLILADLALRPGGFLVMDDAGCWLDISTWRGHDDVSQAVRDHLESNPGYRHLFACGHNRVWQKSPA